MNTPDRPVLLTPRALKTRGEPRSTLMRRVRAGELHRVREGVYVQGADFADLREHERRRIAVFASLVAGRGGDRRVLGLGSAAVLHGIPLFNADPYVHWFLPNKPGRGQIAKGAKAHHVKIHPDDVVEIEGVLVTSPERTAVDLSRFHGFQAGLVAMDHVLHVGGSASDIDQILGRLAGCQGVVAARAVADFADGRSESPGESLAREILGRMPFPEPDLQIEVVVGGTRFRIDLGWKEAKIALEFDGRGKYQESESVEEALFHERRRENLLIEAGWTMIRLTWSDLFDESALRRRLSAVFHRLNSTWH